MSVNERKTTTTYYYWNRNKINDDSGSDIRHDVLQQVLGRNAAFCLPPDHLGLHLGTQLLSTTQHPSLGSTPPQSLKPEPWWSCDVTCLDPGSPDVQQPGVLVQLQLILLLHVVQLLSGQLRLDDRKKFSKSSDNPEGVGGRVFILLISWPFLVCLQNTSLDSFCHQRQTLELCSDAWPLP